MPTTQPIVIPDVPVVNVIVDPFKYDNCTTPSRTAEQNEQKHNDQITHRKTSLQQSDKSIRRSAPPYLPYTDITAVRIPR